RNLAAQSKADGLSAGRDAIGSAASGSGSGSSIEKAKMRYLKEHFVYIRDMIMKNISYPHMARKMGWEGRVVISFVVEESGRVEDIRVIESSGIGLLDKNAVQTIIKASPFPKPPVKAALIIPVVYKLN
ncbi:MAG: energy transducer TonB, partial [Nitrospirota bacterium]|nr:energy transducer TonB [Nitrospirota bacterium]